MHDETERQLQIVTVIFCDNFFSDFNQGEMICIKNKTISIPKLPFKFN